MEINVFFFSSTQKQKKIEMTFIICWHGMRTTEFIYPASWVGDQRLLYRAAEKSEFKRSLDPPPLNSSNGGRRNINEPVVAFGPPGSTGELNVSVIVSPVSRDFS